MTRWSLHRSQPSTCDSVSKDRVGFYLNPVAVEAVQTRKVFSHHLPLLVHFRPETHRTMAPTKKAPAKKVAKAAAPAKKAAKVRFRTRTVGPFFKVFFPTDYFGLRPRISLSPFGIDSTYYNPVSTHHIHLFPVSVFEITSESRLKPIFKKLAPPPRTSCVSPHC